MCAWVCAYRLESRNRKNLPFCCFSLRPLFWIISWLTGMFNPFGTSVRIKARSSLRFFLPSLPYRISHTKELQKSTFYFCFWLSSDHRQMFTWVKTCIGLWELHASGKLRMWPEITHLKENTTSLRPRIPQQSKYANQRTPGPQGEKKAGFIFLSLMENSWHSSRETCIYSRVQVLGVNDCALNITQAKMVVWLADCLCD